MIKMTKQVIYIYIYICASIYICIRKNRNIAVGHLVTMMLRSDVFRHARARSNSNGASKPSPAEVFDIVNAELGKALRELPWRLPTLGETVRIWQDCGGDTI